MSCWAAELALLVRLQASMSKRSPMLLNSLFRCELRRGRAARSFEDGQAPADTRYRGASGGSTVCSRFRRASGSRSGVGPLQPALAETRAVSPTSTPRRHCDRASWSSDDRLSTHIVRQSVEPTNAISVVRRLRLLDQNARLESCYCTTSSRMQDPFAISATGG